MQSAPLLAIPKMLQHIIDVVIPLGDADRLIPLAALLVPLVIVMLGAMAVRNVVQIKVQEHSAERFAARAIQPASQAGLCVLRRSIR